MLFTFLTTLIVYCTKKIHETYWCSSSIAYQEKGTNWILRIFTSNDKNPVYLPIISILQFFWGSEWSRNNSISHKTIQHIPNIKNNEFKIKKKCHIFPNPLLFFIYFFKTIFHINSEINPPPPIISVVCKYLTQFFGTSFVVVTQ